MPPTNEPPHRHAKKAPPARRKAKPKFEIPAETGLPEAPVGWVYRAEEVLSPSFAARKSKSPQSGGTDAPRQREELEKKNPFVVAGMSLFFIGAGTVGLISVAALGVVSAPMRMAVQLMSSD